MNGYFVQTRDLGVRYREVEALRGVTLDLSAGKIYGLLGRNGSGKSTLLSTFAALRRPTSGTVLVDGEDPMENERLMRSICLIREGGDVIADEKISATLQILADVRPDWDADYAARLLDAFEIRVDRRPDKLSRGQRSAVAATMGLASRCPLTMFDEVHLGMDAPTRHRFYDALLADYVEHPRTIIISSHLVDEIAPLVESVIILRDQSVLLHEPADRLREYGLTVTGSAPHVRSAVAGLPVLAERTLGSTLQVTLLAPDRRVSDQLASTPGVEIGGIGLQDLFIHLTEKETAS
ncbi:ATP-binding cassette domain-containing protein [uncultured Aeromicrobium sp.]|uniref:ATP-binding cassette domain-containing protein n=1 Tax=uncultured Aeromicrobium sp. TaxID=337820 RepID=UPI0025D1D4F1|nr:ABC transporter ATP-binding protein [uncultured Aeromicrobium sp.]